MDRFTIAYIAAVLWISIDRSDESGGEMPADWSG